MRNIKLIIQYDGGSFSGWQRQKNAATIQEVLETKISTILQEKISILGSGRTDRGVHALGQVANFRTSSPLAEKQMFHSFNSFLPKTIRITRLEEVDLDFHARFSAVKRQYKYIIYNDLICPPFIREYVYLIKKTLDVNKLAASLKLLEGEHDFTSFASVRDDSEIKIRTVYETKVEKQGPEITIWISANGFLRKMVRMVMGLALEINLLDLPIEHMTEILEMKSREKSYQTLPPHGLYLHKVWYNQTD